MNLDLRQLNEHIRHYITNNLTISVEKNNAGYYYSDDQRVDVTLLLDGEEISSGSFTVLEGKSESPY